VSSTFHVNHSIPGCLAIAIHTGAGTVLHTGDIKLDQLPLDDQPTDLPGMSRLGDSGWTCSSATQRIPRSRRGPSESEIGPNMHRLIRGAEGRVIVACFASNVARVQQIIDASVRLAARCRSSAGRWCATWASPRNSGTSRSTDDVHRHRRRRDDAAERCR
jgi:ribonuclease J